MNNHSNNQNDEWFTPPEYLESARAVMGSIDFDPASSIQAQRNVRATVFHTKENSSLTPDVEWCGNVWMNPPYSRVIKEFVSKLVHQRVMGNIVQAVIVTNNGTDTKWFHELAAISSAFCLHKGRIGFMNESGERIANNNKGQIFFYIGDNPDAFEEEFSQYGKVVR